VNLRPNFGLDQLVESPATTIWHRPKHLYLAQK